MDTPRSPRDGSAAVPPPGPGSCPWQASCDQQPALVSGSQLELFRATVRALAHVVDLDEAFLAVRPGGGDRFAIAATTADAVLPPGSGLDGLEAAVVAAASGGRVVRPAERGRDEAGESWSRILSAGLRSLLIVPLAGGRETIGALLVASRSAAAIGREHDAFLVAVGRQLGVGLWPVPDGGAAVGPAEGATLPRQGCPRHGGCSRNGGIVAVSAALREVLARIDLVAPTTCNVLVLGESGTGKELIAQEVHRRSRRAAGPLVAVNCASVPRELFESEFFGHVRGAFTGAVRSRAGRFQEADGGTLFLDEIAEIPPHMQSKLLRVLQNGRFERVGDGASLSADVRIVAATNRDLAAEVEAGQFRADLYYRLDVFRIELPPLRDRPEAIEPLAWSFLRRFSAELNLPLPEVDETALGQLRSYHWPGNVRELQNVIERAMILSRGGRLRLDLEIRPQAAAAPHSDRQAAPPRVLTADEMRRFERDNLEAALRASDGKIYGLGGAAELLGVPPSTLSDRLARLGLTVRRRRLRPSGHHESS